MTGLVTGHAERHEVPQTLVTLTDVAPAAGTIHEAVAPAVNVAGLHIIQLRPYMPGGSSRGVISLAASMPGGAGLSLPLACPDAATAEWVTCSLDIAPGLGVYFEAWAGSPLFSMVYWVK